MSVAKKKDGTLIVMNRNGEIIVTDEQGRERERYGVVYGAKLLVRDGQKVEPNTLLAEWDPYSMPIITEVAGRVKYGDLVDGVTISEQVDEVTGLARKVVIASKDPDARPRISIKDDEGKTRKLANSEADARYMLPEGANLVVNDGDELDAGDVIAKMPRETTKTKDITGGLPRVAELFEARKPKEHAVISEIDGVVSFGKDTKGKRKVVITPEVDGKLRPDLAKEYLIGKGKHISRAHGRPRARGRGAHGRRRRTRTTSCAVLGEKELAALARGRGAGGLPAPGREDQRQAHRDDRPADAPPRARSSTWATRTSSPTSRSRSSCSRRRTSSVIDGGRAPGAGRAAAARHHEGVALDRVVHLGVVLPGDDEGAHRGRDQRQGRPPPRPEGERHHGPAHPGRHRPAALQAPRHRGRDAGGRRRGGRGGPRGRRGGVAAPAPDHVRSPRKGPVPTRGRALSFLIPRTNCVGSGKHLLREARRRSAGIPRSGVEIMPDRASKSERSARAPCEPCVRPGNGKSSYRVHIWASIRHAAVVVAADAGVRRRLESERPGKLDLMSPQL